MIGREFEKTELNRILKSKEAGFLALYGRRRIGKTFLIREHFKKELCFELTGTKDGKLKEQLANFHHELSNRSRKVISRPESWQEAFQQLGAYLKSLRGKGKRVIFLDELPWLASPRSRFLQSLDYFWNTFLSKDDRLILVICGSAASWMIEKVICDKGGLHNRVTHRMRLEPFTLAESEDFLRAQGVKLSRYDQLMLAMVMGGVPHYLKEARPGLSASQIIDLCCFDRNALLRDEFNRLYDSLYDHPERHVEIIRTLSKQPQGIIRSDLADVYKSGGRLTSTLRELEEGGFISIHMPLHNKSKDSIYRLSDEYSLFYLKFIQNKKRIGAGSFLKVCKSPAWRAWSGYALESLAQKHIELLKNALGISQVDTENCSWVHRPNKTWTQGVQVDLLLDRSDQSLNLFEIKFCEGPFTITKAYAADLRRKIQVFKEVTGTKKNVFLTFLTTYGLTENVYEKELVASSLTTDALFKSAL